MYRDLKRYYWWNGMKQEIAKCVARYLVCQKVKAEHQRLASLVQPLEILQWKREHVTMDFVIGLSWTIQNNDTIWVIVNRLAKSGERRTYLVRVGYVTLTVEQQEDQGQPAHMGDMIDLYWQASDMSVLQEPISDAFTSGHPSS
mgnify:CR=1 FL=1